MQQVVETQPKVHYLIDFADEQDADTDQVDRFDFSSNNIFNLKPEMRKLSPEFPRQV